jgi:hypothetical protein
MGADGCRWGCRWVPMGVPMGADGCRWGADRLPLPPAKLLQTAVPGGHVWQGAYRRAGYALALYAICEALLLSPHVVVGLFK